MKLVGVLRKSCSPPSIRSAIAAALTMLAVHPATAQPVNDTCDGATVVVLGANAISNVGATYDDGRGCPHGLAFASVFYRFTAPATSIYRVTTCNGILWNSRLAVYADCNESSPIACNGDDPACGQRSTITWGATQGTTYIIRLSGESEGAFGGGNMFISESGPLNDDSANATATPLTGSLSPLTGSNIRATTDGTSTCGGVNDVWYLYTPEFNHSLDIAMCDGDFDPVLSIYLGEPGTLFQLACSTTESGGPCPTQERPFIRIPVMAGFSYFIRVASLDGAVGNFNMYLLLAPPGNDDCKGALPLSVGEEHAGTTVGATTDGSGSCGQNGGAGGADVWYTITPSSPGGAQFSVSTPTWHPMLTLYQGSCGDLEEISCNNGPGYAAVTGCLLPGTTYYLRVAGSTSSNSGPYTLTSHQISVVPNTESCNSAITVVAPTTYFDTSNNCVDEGASCFPASRGEAIWFEYTATCDGMVELNTCGSSFDTLMTVSGGTCGNLIVIACDDDAEEGPCPGKYDSHVAFAATANTTYRIRIAGYRGAHGPGQLNIRNLNAPTNDWCENAFPLTAITESNHVIDHCTTRDGAASCEQGAVHGRDVWYSVTATLDGSISVTLCSDGPDHLTLSAFEGTCDAMTPIACSRDGRNYFCETRASAQIVFPSTAGETYLVRVAAMQSDGFVSYSIRANELANDMCDAPRPVPSHSTYRGDNTHATNDIGGGCGRSSSRDVWFSYVPSCDHVLTLDTIGSSFENVLSLYTGECGNLRERECNQGFPGGGMASRVTHRVTAGVMYRIRIAGEREDRDFGSYVLNVGPIAPNNTCPIASPIQNGATPFSTICASSTGWDEECIEDSSPSIWFNYTATCTTTVNISTCGSDFDTVLAAYTGDCSALTAIACNDNTADRCPEATTSSISFPVTAGGVYRIRVGGYGSQSGNGVLHITCGNPCPCDWNSDFEVTSQDFFDFITDFFNSTGDYNRDGAVTSQDFFDFLTCFFAGCP